MEAQANEKPLRTTLIAIVLYKAEAWPKEPAMHFGMPIGFS